MQGAKAVTLDHNQMVIVWFDSTPCYRAVRVGVALQLGSYGVSSLVAGEQDRFL